MSFKAYALLVALGGLWVLIYVGGRGDQPTSAVHSAALENDARADFAKGDWHEVPEPLTRGTNARWKFDMNSLKLIDEDGAQIAFYRMSSPTFDPNNLGILSFDCHQHYSLNYSAPLYLGAVSPEGYIANAACATAACKRHRNGRSC